MQRQLLRHAKARRLARPDVHLDLILAARHDAGGIQSPAGQWLLHDPFGDESPDEKAMLCRNGFGASADRLHKVGRDQAVRDDGGREDANERDHADQADEPSSRQCCRQERSNGDDSGKLHGRSEVGENHRNGDPRQDHAENRMCFAEGHDGHGGQHHEHGQTAIEGGVDGFRGAGSVLEEGLDRGVEDGLDGINRQGQEDGGEQRPGNRPAIGEGG